MSRAPIFLAGATAVGKSAVALELAELLGGEIVSMDSMQVYRGMDIGTAKPGPEERRRVPHHLLDVAAVSETFDAAQFVALAKAAERDIQTRGKVPIFCGGTGLYFRAFLEGLGGAPPSDPALREALSGLPLEQLLAELEARDPAAFEKIDRQNPRRVIRAVEVIRLTGRPFWEQRAAWTAGGAPTPFAYGLFRSVEAMSERIRRRVDRMFAEGLVEETRGLLGQGLGGNPAAMQALGYRQVVEHLRGERDAPATVELVKIRTGQFAKRQRTWFRKQMSLEWIDADAPPEALAKVLAQKYR